mmetsp:Transcript_12501/g.19267  ORF Transcript_12501/g.19267 Transcript_12501/m.19267 type:complete len:180 (-) Transcript_12501:880-1419(-)
MGFTQVPGVDFTDSFAPVVFDVTVRILFILWMVYMWSTQMLDVETAFLYGNLDVPLYMHLPEGMDAPPNSCLKFLKMIYGLVQNSRLWWKTFTRHLKSKAFRVSQADQCLFVQQDEDGVCIFVFYVEDAFLMERKLLLTKQSLISKRVSTQGISWLLLYSRQRQQNFICSPTTFGQENA